MTLLKKLPKVVVFDFNGTLLDDLHVAYGSVQELFKTYSIPCPTLEQFREEISSDFMEFYFRHGFLRPTTKNELEMLVTGLQTIRRSFYRVNEDHARIRVDAPRTISRLLVKGFYVAIVSAEKGATLYRYLVKSGLQRQFDCIMSGAWGYGAKKNALLEIGEIFRTHPADLIYIDDTVDGLSSARDAGVVPVAFTNSTGYHPSHRLMEITNLNINEISELEELLKV